MLTSLQFLWAGQQHVHALRTGEQHRLYCWIERKWATKMERVMNLPTAWDPAWMNLAMIDILIMWETFSCLIMKHIDRRSTGINSRYVKLSSSCRRIRRRRIHQIVEVGREALSCRRAVVELEFVELLSRWGGRCRVRQAKEKPTDLLMVPRSWPQRPCKVASQKIFYIAM
jgi:hypothetical protein